MRDCGIADVHIVVGHLGYQVASAFGDGSSYGVHIHFVEQESTLGLAHAVGALESRIQVPFLLMLGDIYFHLKAPLRPLCEEVLSGEVNANLVSMYEPDPEMVRRNFVIQADDNGRVRRVIEKPRYVDSQLKGCGLYVFDPHIFDAIRRTPRTAMRDEYEITDSIQILIDDGYVTHHHPIVERDLNLTKPADLLTINLIELERSGLSHLVDASARLPQRHADRAQRDRQGRGHRPSDPHHEQRDHARCARRHASTDLDSVVMDGEHTVYCPGVPAAALAQLPVRHDATAMKLARARHGRRRLHRIAPDAARCSPSGLRVTVLDNLSVGRRDAVPDGARFVHGDVRDDAAIARRAAGRGLRLSPRRAGHDPRQLRSIPGGSRHQRHGHGAPAVGARSGAGQVVHARLVDGDLCGRGFAGADRRVASDASAVAVRRRQARRRRRVGARCSRARGIPFTAVRYFNTYGPGQGYTPYVGVLTIFVTRLLRGESITIFGDGEQQRDFVHVSDIVSGTIATLGSAPGRYNLGTGQGTTLNQLASMVLARLAPGQQPLYAAGAGR